MPAVVECRRGQSLETSDGEPLGIAWTATTSAAVLTKAQAEELRGQGQLPAPGELLLVRLKPGARTDWTLTLRLQFVNGGPLEREYGFEAAPERLNDEGIFSAAFLFVHGEGDAPEAFPLIDVVDVTEGTELGFAPTVDVVALGAPPIPIRLGEPGPPAKKRLQLVEFEDALFRTESAVVMPGGDDPEGAGSDPSTPPPGGIGVVATTLRFLDEQQDPKRFLVAGHTDTTGSDAYNLPLSEDRAACGLALLTGDRERFVATAEARHLIADYQQILTFMAETFQLDCDPGGIDGVHGPNTTQAIRRFQEGYNARDRLGNHSAPPLAVDGVLGPATWGGFFDGYEAALAEKLGVDLPGLAALRERTLTPVDPAHPAVGCGEFHPIEGLGKDEFRSEANRRVETLLFDEGEQPRLPCHAGAACQPDACPIYTGAEFEREHLPLMTSAAAWTARWEGEAKLDATARLVVETPGLAAGTPVELAVQQEGFGEVARLQATAQAERVEAEFGDWFQPQTVRAPLTVEQPERFPPVRFTFTAAGGGRTARSDAIEYADLLNARLVSPDGDPLATVDYLLEGPWGLWRGRTDADGVARVPDLPPGGVRIVIGERVVGGGEA